MAIPFFRNTLAGDLVFTGVLFGLFELFLRSIRASEKKAIQANL
jgi:hypothetical protein